MSSSEYTLMKKYVYANANASTGSSANTTCDNNANNGIYTNICTINRGVDTRAVSNTGTTGFTGFTGSTGPTGYGERYSCIIRERISKTNLFNDALYILMIEPNLSYYIGDRVSVLTTERNIHNEYQGFLGEVDSYNSSNGELILRNVRDVTSSFDNDIYSYRVSINNVGSTGYTGVTGPTGVGERYRCIKRLSIMTSDLEFDSQISIFIESALSYYPGDNVDVVSMERNSSGIFRIVSVNRITSTCDSYFLRYSANIKNILKYF